MARTAGVNPAPQLAVIDGQGTRETRSGAKMAPISVPPGIVLDEKTEPLWKAYIADNPYLDAQDGAMAYMWCVEYARFIHDPRGMTAADKSQMLKMMNDLYLSAAERSRKEGGASATGARPGAASKYLSRRQPG